MSVPQYLNPRTVPPLSKTCIADCVTRSFMCFCFFFPAKFVSRPFFLRWGPSWRTYVFWVVRGDAHHPVERHFSFPSPCSSRKGLSGGTSGGFVVDSVGGIREGHGMFRRASHGNRKAGRDGTTAPDLPSCFPSHLTLYSPSFPSSGLNSKTQAGFVGNQPCLLKL